MQIGGVLKKPPRHYGGGSGFVGKPEILDSQWLHGIEGRIASPASYSLRMGKGLREPCSPYREAYVFGAELNVPSAKNWNCPAEIVDPTNFFDLSVITPYHEVVVQLFIITDLHEALTVSMKWYRDRDNKLLYTTNYNIPALPGDQYWLWYYVYSYIGYVPHEIWEDGDYHVDVVAGSYSRRRNFSIIGSDPIETGQITAAELEYNSSQEPVPVQDVEKDKVGRVHMWARNDMANNQKLGMFWKVTDPSGIEVENYYEWQPGETSPDDEHEFIGSSFNLNKLGDYEVDAGMLMDEDDPIYVDVFNSTLCNVVTSPGIIFIEGNTYPIYFAVTNESEDNNGNPVSAVLKFVLRVMIYSEVILQKAGTYSFDEGETQGFNYPFTIPVGSAGKSGSINVSILNPKGEIITEESIAFSVRS